MEHHMHILHIDSGIFAGQSISRKLAADLLQHLQSRNPGATVTYRDLVANPPAHLNADILIAAGKPEDARTAFEKEQLALTQTLQDELFAANVLLIGAPMYNFSLPSQLKAWLDRVLQAGKTFRYTEKGPEGLVKNCKAYMLSSRGGSYSAGPMLALDHQESYLKAALGFIGITDVQIIRAEGVAMGDEAKANAISLAQTQIAGV
jgi:FMN-dependent NADH-azoreductase